MWTIGRLRQPALWIIAGVLLLVSVGVLYFALVLPNALTAAAKANAEADEARAVYCMSSQHRAQLLETASNLGLGEPVKGKPNEIKAHGSEMSIRAWRTGDDTRSDFERACRALAAAMDGPAVVTPAGAPNPAATFAIGVLTALVPVAAGSWLTYMTGARKDATGLRRLQVDNLRGAALRFSQAAEAYLRTRSTSGGQSGQALLDAMHERRLELAAALGQIAAMHPNWGVATLRDRLESEWGGDFIGRAGQIDAERASQLRAKVSALTAEMEVIAIEHETNGRRTRQHARKATKAQVTNTQDTPHA